MVYMEKKYKLLFTIIGIIGFLYLIFVLVPISAISVKGKIKIPDLEDVDSIMIVAHPDDESLWGGKHLLDENYLVVCVTCGSDEKREEEFEEAMDYTNSSFISLGYPDLTDGKKDNWNKCYNSIKKDINIILEKKSFEKIVTHNPNGEYGHIHHKMVSDIVTSVSEKNKLFYFDLYYPTNYSGSNMMSEMDLMDKENILSIYKSQDWIINNHRHTIGYENFISYEKWKKKYSK